MAHTVSPTAERGELVRSLGVLCERPDASHVRLARWLGLPPPDPAAHTELFVHQLPPLASIFLDHQGMIGGEARDLVAGFWRALHITPPVEPDHLASLLGLSASLSGAADEERSPERRKIFEHSHQALTWEHLVSWLVPYLTRMEELADETYRSWAQLLGLVLNDELKGVGVFDPPSLLFAAPETEFDSVDSMVGYILSPVRSGIVLTRADLHRASVDMSLGRRIGERAFTMKALMDQDRRLVIDWLATEAVRQAEVFASSKIHDEIAQIWAQKARQTAIRLREIPRRP